MSKELQSVNERRYRDFMARWGLRKAEIEELYFVDGLSQKAIGQRYGVTLVVVQKAMKRLGIQSRGRGRRGAEHHQYRHGRDTVLYRKAVTKEECAQCGQATNLGIHHLNYDHYDNRPENLQVLCVSCHMSEHKKSWWNAVKQGRQPLKSNAPMRWSS